jgi:DNA-binding response OmpR family regulator
MKLLVVLGSDEILGLIAQNLEPLGFELIRYQQVLKAMDNIDEIAPSAIIVSARDFPRHWKTLVQFTRYSRAKTECPIILLTGPNFTLEDASKAFFLGVSGIVSEDLTRPSEVDQLQRLLSRYLELAEKRGAPRFHLEDAGEAGVCAVNPVTRSLITGRVKTISASGLSFEPEEALSLDTLGVNIELSECSLRIGEDLITPICRVARTKPDMSMEFIFLPDVDRILLDKYLEALPLTGLPRPADSP